MTTRLWPFMQSTYNIEYGQYFESYSEGSSLWETWRCAGYPVRGVIDTKCNNSKEKKNNMNEKLNLVEILKDAPMDTKLYSPICGECELFQVNATSNTYPIVCVGFDDGMDYYFNSDGTYTENEGVECLLFPSKDNRDWSTFKASNEHKHFETFQKVLRIAGTVPNHKIWIADFYSHYNEANGKHYLTSDFIKGDDELIPYDGNEDKVGKIVEK